jgi:hypothetical protein
MQGHHRTVPCIPARRLFLFAVVFAAVAHRHCMRIQVFAFMFTIILATANDTRTEPNDIVRWELLRGGDVTNVLSANAGTTAQLHQGKPPALARDRGQEI